MVLVPEIYFCLLTCRLFFAKILLLNVNDNGNVIGNVSRTKILGLFPLLSFSFKTKSYKPALLMDVHQD